MRTLKQIWAAGLGALLACQACNLGAGEEIARHDFKAELVHAVCDSVPQCCVYAELQFDAATCREMMLKPVGGQLDAPAVSYDAEAGSDCIERAHILSERCERVPPTICAGAFRGLIAPGGPCRSTFECDPGPLGLSVCSPEGICVLPARGTIGQPCSYTCKGGGSRADCKSIYGGMGPAQTACFEDDGMVCFLPKGEGAATCQPLNIDCNQRFDSETACPPGGFCDPISGGCYPFAPIGAACAPGGGRCGFDAFCSAGVCIPKQPITARCLGPEQCASGRCSGGYCTLYSSAAAAMCRGDTT